MIPLDAARPGAREEQVIVFVRGKFSLQDKIARARRESSARLDAGLPSAAAKPGLLNNLGLSRVRILFTDAKMLEHRMADLQADGLDAR